MPRRRKRSGIKSEPRTKSRKKSWLEDPVFHGWDAAQKKNQAAYNKGNKKKFGCLPSVLALLAAIIAGCIAIA